MKQIVPQLLTAEGFAPYGDVIAGSQAARARVINQGATTRFDDLAQIDVARDGGSPRVSLFRTAPLARPLILRMMERHPLSSQAFVPLSPRPYLVVVAHGAAFPSGIKAFVAGPHQGINYRPGVWHHFSLALEETSDFLVIDRKGAGENLDEVTFDDAHEVCIDEVVLAALLEAGP